MFLFNRRPLSAHHGQRQCSLVIPRTSLSLRMMSLPEGWQKVSTYSNVSVSSLRWCTRTRLKRSVCVCVCVSQLQDEASGRDYFFNSATGTTSWDPPVISLFLACPLPLSQCCPLSLPLTLSVLRSQPSAMNYTRMLSGMLLWLYQSTIKALLRLY